MKIGLPRLILLVLAGRKRGGALAPGFSWGPPKIGPLGFKRFSPRRVARSGKSRGSLNTAIPIPISASVRVNLLFPLTTAIRIPKT